MSHSWSLSDVNGHREAGFIERQLASGYSRDDGGNTLVREAGGGEEHLCVLAWIRRQMRGGKAVGVVDTGSSHESVPAYPHRLVLG